MNLITRKKIIQSILNQPLDGKFVKIQNHTNSFFISLSGLIISESKALLKITIKGGKTIMISKNEGTFIFKVENSSIQIHGNLLVGDYTTRAKKKYRNW
ncbi:MAG: ribonuclease P protein subunit [Candidatus Kariarchaeaceae archaeon]